MTTLVWIFLILCCLVSGFISNRITAWYYKMKIKKLTKIIAKHEKANP